MKSTLQGLAVLLVICLLSLSYDLVRMRSLEKQLHLEDLSESLSLSSDNTFRSLTFDFLSVFADKGFPDGYAAVYQHLASPLESAGNHKHAAAAALTLAVQGFQIQHENRISSIRLLIQYLTRYHLTLTSALAWQKLDKGHKLFSANAESAELFNRYLREVWAVEIKPEVSKARVMTEKALDFLRLFPQFTDETTKLFDTEQNGEEQWKYVLIEGRTGENEEDFALQKVPKP